MVLHRVFILEMLLEDSFQVFYIQTILYKFETFKQPQFTSLYNVKASVLLK